MSAHMVGQETWDTIIEAVTMPDPYGTSVEVRLEVDYKIMIQNWFVANSVAVGARYGDHPVTPKLAIKPSPKATRAAQDRAISSTITQERTETLVQYMKSIMCLRYQCCETVPAQYREAHKATLDEMDKVLGILGERLAHSLPSFETATWG